jgi:5-methylcytosine-specific restriction endonuclease McrA
MGTRWSISPEKLKARSIRLKKYYAEHPEKKPIPPSRKGCKSKKVKEKKVKLSLKDAHLKYYIEHPEAKKRISEERKRWFSENRHKLTKENSSNWKGGITPLIRQIRKCFKMRQWICDVFTKDDYTCQKCGVRGGKLEAHHSPKLFSVIFHESGIKTVEEALEYSEFWDINNGKTLCQKCHKEEHTK